MEEGRSSMMGAGRVMGMTRRAVGGVVGASSRGGAGAGGWSWGLWLFGMVVCLLVLPALRRLMLRLFRRRDEEKMQKLEEVVEKEEVEVEELRRALGAPRGVRGLVRGVFGEWFKGLVGKGWMRVGGGGGGGGGKMVELERRGWERVAERQMSLREFSPFSFFFLAVLFLLERETNRKRRFSLFY